jgi:hypothetical protein
MPTDSEIRERIEGIKREKYRMAFAYQYLIAGRISEVCGHYGPQSTEYLETDFDGEPAVMFIVKTAKRKGRLRPVAVPMNPEYEPWTQPVLDYYKKQEGHVFRFAENWKTSIRYMQWEAEKAFEGMEWPMVEYTVKVGEEIDPKTNEKKNIMEKVPPRWKDVTSHVCRKRRALTLLYDYEFDGVDLGIYGGWTLSSQAEEMPPALKSYLHLDPSSSRESEKLLKKMAGRYFHKLLRHS